MLAPGMIVELYGEHLGLASGCGRPLPQNGPYPVEACGVRVTVGSTAASLLFAGPNQINLKIPDDAPQDGVAPMQVCLADNCSEPVPIRFSARKAFLRVHGVASVHMPVWIEVEQPAPYGIYYPYQIWPWDFGRHSFEVRRDGKLLEPLHPAPSLGGGVGGLGILTPAARWPILPLHLLYRFDLPGTYSVRLTTWRSGQPGGRTEIVNQSDWTDIEVGSFSEAKRDAWLKNMAVNIANASSEELLQDYIPSLLAYPDAKALSVLIPLLDYRDDVVPQFARNSLAAFDDALLHQMVPAEKLRRMLRIGIKPRGSN